MAQKNFTIIVEVTDDGESFQVAKIDFNGFFAIAKLRAYGWNAGSKRWSKIIPLTKLNHELFGAGQDMPGLLQDMLTHVEEPRK